MVLPVFMCGWIGVCVCVSLCVLYNKKQAQCLRSVPRELSLCSQIP